jgi:hypothetical protein
MNQLATTSQDDDALALIENPSPEALQAALAEGQLQKLSVPQRLQFLAATCKSLGLNPLTRPFEFITLQGKVVMYARKDATDQLRKRDSISLRIISRENMDGVYVVTAQATSPNGRLDESIGAVPCNKLAGEALANAIMKAEAKAKRRVTLSICGLGFMDETEIDGAKAAPFQDSAPVQMPQTAEVQPREAPRIETELDPPPLEETGPVPTDDLGPLTELLSVIQEADARKLTACVAEVKHLPTDAMKATAKKAIKSRAAELNVVWCNETGAFEIA